MSITTFVNGLSNPPSSAELEEYLTVQGTFDVKYLSALLKERVTENKLRQLINAKLGKITFDKKNIKNEVTREIFSKHYTFGTYPAVRGWIGYFDRVMGMVLTREKLYEYITETY